MYSFASSNRLYYNVSSFLFLFLLILIYRGTGLGKNADGITESIQVKRREENEGVCEILFIDGK